MVGTQRGKRRKEQMRKLRKEIEIILSVITMILIIFVATINDFSLKAIPIILVAIAIIIFNTYILMKYGKGIIYDNNSQL